MRLWLFFVLGLLLTCGGAWAQTQTGVIPGFMAPAGQSGCPSTNACFVPYSSTYPLPVNTLPPPYTSSGTMAVTGSSQSVSVAGVPSTLPNGYLEIRPEPEFNGSVASVNVYVCPMGGACTTSTAGAVALVPGQPKTFRWPTNSPTLPTVIATGTGTTLYLQW